MTKYLQK